MVKLLRFLNTIPLIYILVFFALSGLAWVMSSLEILEALGGLLLTLAVISYPAIGLFSILLLSLGLLVYFKESNWQAKHAMKRHALFLILMNAIYYSVFPIDDFLMARTQLNTDFVVYALYLSVFVLSALLWWNNHNWRQVKH
ncbi:MULTISPECIES: hypothetical protein [Aerococcus]|uniref:Uncharacterized protein n=2 Tax=Aerococcus TaxID=1375 RepID=A0A178HJS4_9LACT|nr:MULTISPECIES: hypothetical protein [Aerococcus]KAA9218233.1 hypothetical protein F6I39_07750 [Aerococcus loyolae]KAA9264489.1 hypothetical protein F6I19_07360 [Aerococcus loyolae]MCY3026049.1 hypothetical protein [Aerococcus loyolae]MCY3027846.1 hypothetical protein [Aerococcus loyolae]MCY3029391.1 hypothetical protein [Aerococcus loyolae]